MKYVRAKLVEAKLRETGEVVAAYPELESIERDAQFSGTIAYILLTQQSRQNIMACLQEISQIEVIHTELITGANLNTFTEGKGAQKTSSYAAQTVRVDVERLEGLLNLVGELIIDNTRLHSVRSRLSEQFKSNSDVHLLNDIAGHLNMVISDLQEGMMKTRMLPMEHLFGRFPG